MDDEQKKILETLTAEQLDFVRKLYIANKMIKTVWVPFLVTLAALIQIVETGGKSFGISFDWLKGWGL